ncbi:hypothetical protein ACQ4M4_23480 [Leptolyngbya sp. AN02str]|uniref:hypothetical protein n=1 Tax=Leptolyngbya sp. AN02str TaxID=3423363 RepID=UPI003D31A48B
MTFKQKLYKLHRRYMSGERLDAMCSATAIANQGYQTVVTVSDSDQEYVVWVDVSFVEDLGEEPPAPTPGFERSSREQVGVRSRLENVEHL